jgi:histidyl-tRNA synthetase
MPVRAPLGTVDGSSPMKLSAPKGTRDITGAEGRAFTRLENVARAAFGLRLFEEVRTPIFEPVELFSRSLGETSDVVEKEMFTFTDRGERTYALRPEGTAGVVRYFIENDLAVKAGIHRLSYMGPMFRAERPQAGRYRQFWQIGSEHFGEADAVTDAETVVMVAEILSSFGVTGFEIQVNSIGCKECRPRHRDALLAYLKTREAELTEESRRRMLINPLRVLDSKVDGPKLTDAPVMRDFLCDACRAHHVEFRGLLKSTGLNVLENPRLVRGLDYYTRTVFEFVSNDLGAQNALAAGGRYDELVQSLGGPATPGVGFALGVDRVVSVALKNNTVGPARPEAEKSAVVIPLAAEAVATAFQTAARLRGVGIAVPPVMARKKMKGQLALAVELGSNWAILVGEDELRDGILTVKDLGSRTQEKMSLDALAARLVPRSGAGEIRVG